MKAINKAARKVMDKLTKDLSSTNKQRKVGGDDAGYMPVTVAHVEDTELGPVFRVAHYYTQNGDQMADPEMTFLRIRITGDYYPIRYRVDGLHVDRESARIEGRGFRFKAREQADQATFAGVWMRNIAHQQDLSKI